MMYLFICFLPLCSLFIKVNKQRFFASKKATLKKEKNVGLVSDKESFINDFFSCLPLFFPLNIFFSSREYQVFKSSSRRKKCASTRQVCSCKYNVYKRT